MGGIGGDIESRRFVIKNHGRSYLPKIGPSIDMHVLISNRKRSIVLGRECRKDD